MPHHLQLGTWQVLRLFQQQLPPLRTRSICPVSRPREDSARCIRVHVWHTRLRGQGWLLSLLFSCPGAEGSPAAALPELFKGLWGQEDPGVYPPRSGLMLRTHRSLSLPPVSGGCRAPASDTNGDWLARRPCMTLVLLEFENLPTAAPSPVTHPLRLTKPLLFLPRWHCIPEDWPSSPTSGAPMTHWRRPQGPAHFPSPTTCPGERRTLTGREDLGDGAAAAQERLPSKSLLPSRACGGHGVRGMETGTAGQRAPGDSAARRDTPEEEADRPRLSLTVFGHLDKSLDSGMIFRVWSQEAQGL